MGKLHPEAHKAYNSKAEALAAAVEPMPPRATASNIPPEKSDTPISAHFGPNDIRLESYREHRVDRTGERLACYFYVEGRGLVGIAGSSHAELASVARRIASDRVYRQSLSEDFAYRTAMDWLKLRTEAADKNTVPGCVEYIEEAAAKAITRFEVWFPIPAAQITRPFQIGRTWFRRITKSMMDAYADKVKADSSPRNEAAFDRLRSRIQASTAACVEVEAEPIRGDQIARAESEASISIFRLACPAMLDVYQWAPLDPSFVDGFGSAFSVHVKDGAILGHQSGLPDRMCSQWVIQPAELEHNFWKIWAFGHNLIVTDRNEFQELLLGALIHYSKSVLKADPSERLMYVVTALESLLIKDARESIVQNLRERLAVMAGPSAADRVKTSENVTKVYDIRSKFVHSALPVPELAVLADFFVEAWTTMVFLLNNYNKWRTKADFLSYVDSYKFRGPEFNTTDLGPLGAG